VEFTGVELAGGAELAAPVKKGVAGPVVKNLTDCYGGEGRVGGRRG
jgi:hypothetical protein